MTARPDDALAERAERAAYAVIWPELRTPAPDGPHPLLAEAMRAALAVVREAEGWRPIESAPRDGTVVLVYVPDFGKVTEAWFSQVTGLWPHDAETTEEGEPCNVGKPTHWRPLPAPPEDAGS